MVYDFFDILRRAGGYSNVMDGDLLNWRERDARVQFLLDCRKNSQDLITCFERRDRKRTASFALERSTRILNCGAAFPIVFVRDYLFLYRPTL